MEKLANQCVVHITPEKMEFRKKREPDSEIEVYATIKVELFSEYTVESRSDNTISVILSVTNLLRAVKSANQSTDTTFKLSRRNDVPGISIVAETVSGINIVQDVPILEMLSKEGLEDYEEPALSFSMILGFPDPKHVRTVLDRFKGLDDHVVMLMNRTGSLTLRVDTEVVTMKTVYRDLDVLEQENSAAQNVVVKLNVKEFLSVLNFGASKFDKIYISTGKGLPVVLFVNFEDSCGNMTYYCPTLNLDEN